MSNCSVNNFKKVESSRHFSVEIETPYGKYNNYFKENLKRLFYFRKNETSDYLLKTEIKFNSTNTLSVSGISVLKSTKAEIDYQLIQKNTNKLIKSGSINTFPTLSSSSSSLYTQEKSIAHIRERLVKSSAKSLYMHIRMILSRSN